MAEATILTAKQRKSSLSARKTKTKETIKNSLYTPFKQYWPCINEDHSNSLKANLDQYLPKLLPEKIKLPWADLKCIKRKKNRRKKRRKLIERKILAERGTLDREPIKKDGLIFGVNDVSKALESGKASHILVSADVVPKMLVQHIIDQAVFHRVPILVVPELRNILKQRCGLASIALAFTNCEKYSCLQTIIEEMSANYPVPEDHIHFNRLQNIDIVVETRTLENMEIDKDIFESNVSKDSEETPDVLSKLTHLVRTDKGKRIFIPKQNINQPALIKTENVQPTIDNILELYRPLQVRRSKQNKNRLKDKINKFKKKRKHTNSLNK